MAFSRMIFTNNGLLANDPYASNNKLCSNFFARLNTQRVTYSLGNGVTFNTDGLKERLGIKFDTVLKSAGYDALIHGVSFLFWNVDHVHVFPVTEFAPLWDEDTGALRAGVRYWQIDREKPTIAILYEEDGYTKFKGSPDGKEFAIAEEKRPYKMVITKAAYQEEPEVVAAENYSTLPIIPLWGSRLHQSTLVGMKEKIDAFDLVNSGFANDLQDCAEIYWIVTNAGGMTTKDLDRFRDRLKMHHIANVEDADEVTVTPYTQEIPVNARKTFLDSIRASIYEDFGALDVHTISAAATNDHIDAAYQPLDENADDFEYQVIEAIQNLLQLIGVEDTPLFKRNRISNQKEIVDMIVEVAQYLDEETILTKLPFLSPDEVDAIMMRKDLEDAEKINENDDGEEITDEGDELDV